MKVVDDPMGRVDKTMDEMLITKRCNQHYHPQPCPHFTHNPAIPAIKKSPAKQRVLGAFEKKIS